MRLHLIALVMTVMSFSPTCYGQTLNSKVATFLAGKVGVRVGGGECAHAASEALRSSGAEFTNTDLGTDSPAAGDYVWGTLVKSISIVNGKWTDSNQASKLLPGDIMQYRNTKFVYPTSTATASQHTSVVATVNTAGSATFVYQQNFNGIRTVRKDSFLVTSGSTAQKRGSIVADRRSSHSRTTGIRLSQSHYLLAPATSAHSL